VDLRTKLTNRSALRRISDVQHMDLVTQVDGPVMTKVLLAASGHGRRSAVESNGGGNQSNGNNDVSNCGNTKDGGALMREGR
jgi:hypothetical protein